MSVLKKRYLRLVDVLRIVPMSKSTIYEKMKCGAFPKQFYLSERIAVWDRCEINNWFKKCKTASNDLKLRVA